MRRRSLPGGILIAHFEDRIQHARGVEIGQMSRIDPGTLQAGESLLLQGEDGLVKGLLAMDRMPADVMHPLPAFLQKIAEDIFPGEGLDVFDEESLRTEGCFGHLVTEATGLVMVDHVFEHRIVQVGVVITDINGPGANAEALPEPLDRLVNIIDHKTDLAGIIDIDHQFLAHDHSASSLSRCVLDDA